MKIENKIPKGMYCYEWVNGKRNYCPYYKVIKNRPPYENGWCNYLEEGDIEINKKTEWKNNKTGETKTAREIGLPMSLLWDGCKECEINDEINEEEWGLK